jgi:hypothetical protein
MVYWRDGDPFMPNGNSKKAKLEKFRDEEL